MGINAALLGSFVIKQWLICGEPRDSAAGEKCVLACFGLLKNLSAEYREKQTQADAE